jgi:hypothetical protein
MWIRTSLSDCDDVMTSQHCRDAVGLNGRGVRVLAKGDVLLDDGMKAGVFELEVLFSTL